MYDDRELADLPEVLPLARVAPFWRVLAIVTALAALGLFFVACILGLALSTRPIQVVNAPVPAAPMVPPPPFAGMVAAQMAPEEDQNPGNLPYPVKADLQTRDLPPPRVPFPQAPARRTARDLFLGQTAELWKSRQLPLLAEIFLSPDGRQVAYIVKNRLFAGPLDNPRDVLVDLNVNVAAGAAPGFPPVATRPGIMGGIPGVEDFPPPWIPTVPLVWSSDGDSVLFATTDGRLRRYHLAAQRLDSLPFVGTSPALVPGKENEVAFVRSAPLPKLDNGTGAVPIDPTEVVVGDVATQETRVVIPAGPTSWYGLTVSPDGKRLALLARADPRKPAQGQKHRAVVVDLEGGKPQDIPLPTEAYELCWAPDGKGLVYGRRAETPSAEAWESGAAPDPGARTDLYHLNLADRKETRLSRGGNFHSPVPNLAEGNLVFAAVMLDKRPAYLTVRSGKWEQLQRFARDNAPLPVRDRAAWMELLDQVFDKVKLAEPLDGGELTPQVIGAITHHFRDRYNGKFLVPPPETGQQLERLMLELRSLDLPADRMPRVRLLLALLQGELLVKHYGARWHLSRGPLLAPEGRGGSWLETPFAYVLSPFVPERGLVSAPHAPSVLVPSLVEILDRAQGRTILLTNDPAAVAAACDALTDPELARGVELLKQQPEEGEKVLTQLPREKRHAGNQALAYHVGKLLYEHRRIPTLRRYLDEWDPKPQAAQVFNLIGLAFLRPQGGLDQEADLQRAIDAFRSALRCDLLYAPAYFNLAQAYQQNGDTPSAQKTLTRYLELMPAGEYADDARRRLGALEVGAAAGAAP